MSPHCRPSTRSRLYIRVPLNIDEPWAIRGRRKKNSTYLSLIYEVEASDAEQTKVVSTHSQTSPNSSFSFSFILPINSSEWCCLSSVPLAVCLRPGSKHPRNKVRVYETTTYCFHPAAGEGSFLTFRNDLTKIPQNEFLAFGNEMVGNANRWNLYYKIWFSIL